jgi:hypothetical protein
LSIQLGVNPSGVDAGLTKATGSLGGFVSSITRGIGLAFGPVGGVVGALVGELSPLGLAVTGLTKLIYAACFRARRA